MTRFCAAVLVLAAAPALASRAAAPRLEQLLAAYAAGDYKIIEKSITSHEQFEVLRKSIGTTVDEWKKAPTRAQAVFLIDVALVGLNHNWVYWLDVLKESRNFVTARRDVGLNQPADAFEIAWHKTSIALLESLRRPDFLDEHGIAPLRNRMAAEFPFSGDNRLIDPWIELARGVLEEQYSKVDANSLTKRAEAAIKHFDEAIKYPSTKDEAMVRKAWLLIQLQRSPDAVNLLEDMTGAINDPVVRYWRHIFLGRGLENVNRIDDAAAEYGQALTVMPRAETPAVAMIALEMRRDRRDEAYRWSSIVKATPPGTVDPWPDYIFADFRFFKQRLVALRQAAQ